MRAVFGTVPYKRCSWPKFLMQGSILTEFATVLPHIVIKVWPMWGFIPSFCCFSFVLPSFTLLQIWLTILLLNFIFYFNLGLYHVHALT